MILFQYLDLLPKIPEHLLEQQQELHRNHYATPVRKLADGSSVVNIEYKRWDLDDELNQWLRENICVADSTGLQISRAVPGSTTHLCHTDSYPRRWVLNYMHKLGGTNIQTRFFKEIGQPLLRDPLTRPTPEKDPNIELIHSVVVEPNRWWLLNSGVLHDVINITGSRESITMGIHNANPFSRIPAYCNLVSF